MKLPPKLLLLRLLLLPLLLLLLVVVAVLLVVTPLTGVEVDAIGLPAMIRPSSSHSSSHSSSLLWLERQRARAAIAPPPPPTAVDDVAADPPRAFDTPHPPHVTLATACTLSQVLVDFVTYLWPTQHVLTNWTAAVASALHVDTLCTNTTTTSPTTRPTFVDRILQPTTHAPIPTDAPTRLHDRIHHAYSRSSSPSSTCMWQVYVSTTNGSDTNPGTFDAPLRTLQRALSLSRAYASTSPTAQSLGACITVRGGTYYLGASSQPLQRDYDSQIGALALTSLDSGLTLAAYDPIAEPVILSAGYPLQLDWQPFAKLAAGTIYRATLPADLSTEFLHLNEFYVGNERAIRARYPNANPSTQGLHTNTSGWMSSPTNAWTVDDSHRDDATFVHVDAPDLPNAYFSNFQVGIDGPVAAFTPPTSYWGVQQPSGGDGITYAVPYRLNYAKTDAATRAANWTHPERGYVHAFHGKYWGSWVFRMRDVNTTAQMITFAEGGWQEARGNPWGGEWHVDNLFEELDSPLEWFVDVDSNTLYFMPNATQPPALIVASQLPSLISLRGSAAAPVTNVSLVGLTFAHTSNTYMRTYEVPSAGDWSIHRGAAVFATGTANLLVTQCLFTQLGGNALMLSEWNLDGTIAFNEFVWLGDSAILLIGSSNGVDGVSNTNQPTSTLVMSNLVHETGIYVKQSAPLCQSLVRATTILGNVMFNAPRALINVNDGFAGGTTISNNVLFNAVRETKDHGPLNTWDRQPYLTTQADPMGPPSFTPALNRIVHNAIVMNYNSLYPVDHDDGSAFYEGYHNVLLYGGDKSYLGHSKQSYANLFVHTQHYCLAYHSIANKSGWDESWTNNTCIVGGDKAAVGAAAGAVGAAGTAASVYNLDGCELGDLANRTPITANNRFYTSIVNSTTGGAAVQIVGCRDATTNATVVLSLAEWQAVSGDGDAGSTAELTPEASVIAEWMRDVLWTNENGNGYVEEEEEAESVRVPVEVVEM